MARIQQQASPSSGSQQGYQNKGSQKADNASQLQPATSNYLTVYTQVHGRASSSQSTRITERYNNHKRSIRRQETERSTVKAEEESRTNITNGYITDASEATSVASTARGRQLSKPRVCATNSRNAAKTGYADPLGLCPCL